MEVNQEVKTGGPGPLGLLKILGKRMSGQAVGLKNTEFNIHLFYFSFPLWFSRLTDFPSSQRTAPT